MKPPDRFRTCRHCLGLAASVLAALFLNACSTEHYLINQRLESPGHEPSAYAMRNLRQVGNSDSLFVVMSISGGGYRAAALGYGVLAALRETIITWEGVEKPLLDELDVITGVSGGSLLVGYYMSYGKDTFDRFESDVLRYDLQTALLARTLSPRGLWRQTSKRFGRSDILQELLDEQIFHGTSFGDLQRTRPMAIINATDIEYGERFEFTQDQFDHICSNLDALPVARAVAASMTVPLVLSPITLWNYKKDCPSTTNPLQLRSHAAFSNYIHLVDGGLADNTGIQTPLELISARGGPIHSARDAGLSGIRKRVFIIVNAQGKAKFEEDAKPDTPTLLRQASAIINVPIDRYSAASIELLKQEVVRWRAELQQATDEQLGGTIARDTDYFVIEVSLVSPPPGMDTASLAAIPTALKMEPASAEALQVYARKALLANPEWQRLMSTLQGLPPSNTASR